MQNVPAMQLNFQFNVKGFSFYMYLALNENVKN